MLSFFPRDVLDEILNLIESVSEGFLPTLILNNIIAKYSLIYYLTDLKLGQKNTKKYEISNLVIKKLSAQPTAYLYYIPAFQKS